MCRRSIYNSDVTALCKLYRLSCGGIGQTKEREIGRAYKLLTLIVILSLVLIYLHYFNIVPVLETFENFKSGRSFLTVNIHLYAHISTSYFLRNLVIPQPRSSLGLRINPSFS